MAYTPYDWNQTVAQKSEYIEDRLRDGSPVVGISFDNGLLLLSIKRGQRKVFEIYDRLMFAALGNQSDIEQVRILAIDSAHTEGYARSPDDVTAHRIVGFVISPPMKRAYTDPFVAPFVMRGVFAEMGKSPKDDSFFTLDYNGEFSSVGDFAVIGGTTAAEEKAIRYLESKEDQKVPSFDAAVERALHAWALARHYARHATPDEDEADDRMRKMEQEPVKEVQPASVLREELKDGELEVGILDRQTSRDRKFRHARREELDAALKRVL